MFEFALVVDIATGPVIARALVPAVVPAVVIALGLAAGAFVVEIEVAVAVAGVFVVEIEAEAEVAVVVVVVAPYIEALMYVTVMMIVVLVFSERATLCKELQAPHAKQKMM